MPDSVNAASSASGIVYQPTSTAKSASGMGKDDFLKILVAQLQNQDPTQPMDNTQFISQMAQFSALEQMQELNTTFGYSQAYSLLGKSVSTQVTNTDGTVQNISGTVNGVTTISNKPYLIVDGNYVSMELPITVDNAGDQVLQGAAMIGKSIQASVAATDGTYQKITGTVSSLSVVNGSVILKVGDKDVKLSDVTNVSSSST